MNVVAMTDGTISYSEIMNMELAEFNDVVLELNIADSAKRFEQMRINNHQRAVNGIR